MYLDLYTETNIQRSYTRARGDILEYDRGLEIEANVPQRRQRGRRSRGSPNDRRFAVQVVTPVLETTGCFCCRVLASDVRPLSDRTR
jgi:hypothetical protein